MLFDVEMNKILKKIRCSDQISARNGMHDDRPDDHII